MKKIALSIRVAVANTAELAKRLNINEEYLKKLSPQHLESVNRIQNIGLARSYLENLLRQYYPGAKRQQQQQQSLPLSKRDIAKPLTQKDFGQDISKPLSEKDLF